ncbi:MAG: gamma carbonic anhydrase family protein [Rhodospirillales bacterium]|nr:gamma carbonic anhydrase family protein [Rhodospirillales bacterium]
MSGLILPFRGVYPRIAPGAFVAPTAVVIGDTEIAEGASLWFGVVVRGDVNKIRIGARSNIQDGAIVHAATGTFATHIGAEVTIGHAAVIHACTIEDRAFIGIKAVVMDGAVVETSAMVAAGALVGPGKRIPSGELWAGSPARFLRKLGPEDERQFGWIAAHYVELAEAYGR